MSADVECAQLVSWWWSWCPCFCPAGTQTKPGNFEPDEWGCAPTGQPHVPLRHQPVMVPGLATFVLEPEYMEKYELGQMPWQRITVLDMFKGLYVAIWMLSTTSQSLSNYVGCIERTVFHADICLWYICPGLAQRTELYGYLESSISLLRNTTEIILPWWMIFGPLFCVLYFINMWTGLPIFHYMIGVMCL